MGPSQDAQLEKTIEMVLKSGDVRVLDTFLQKDINEGNPLKCSGQFLTKLDKLVCRSLDQKDSKTASSCFSMLYKCGKNLVSAGSQGLSGLISKGLIKKMVQWFEKCRQLWIQRGSQWDETLFNLAEQFFDAVLVAHEACREGAYEITELFLYPVGQLAVDPRINIQIQKEASSKFNLILDKIPVELKKQRKILSSQEASDIMIKIAGQILDAGDYDFQTALMESLCRMASPKQRKELADRWFTMGHVADAFIKISDSEFETDCRKFLNLVNGMHGDKRRVYSYPCLEAYLDKHELLMPSDEKLDEFWIDFNLSSHSISFYFSLADEDAQGQWETLCITENEVQSYTVKEEGKKKVLQLKLSEVVIVGSVEGSSLTFQFSSCLDILQAAQRVYGHGKNRDFVGKTGTSVVKTTVKIIQEDNSSQVVPESQVSLSESEKNTVPFVLPTSSVQMVTPGKMRISESATFIRSGSGESVRGAKSLSAVLQLNTSAKGKGKPSLEMVRSSERQGEPYRGELRMAAKTGSVTLNTVLAGGMKEQNDESAQGTASKQANNNKENMEPKTAEMVPAGQAEEQSLEPTYVPDTQPRTVGNTSAYWNKLSVSEMLIMPTQKIHSLPKTAPSSCENPKGRLSSVQRTSVRINSPINQKKLHTELTKRLQQVLFERNQDQAQQESAATPEHLSDTRANTTSKSSVDQSAPEEHVQRNGMAEQKNERQTPGEKDAAAVKAPAKVSTGKEKISSRAKDKTNKALSKKKKRDAAVTGSIVKLISSHEKNTDQHKSKDQGSSGRNPQSSIPSYLNRQIFTMGRLSTSTKKETSVFTKSFSKTTNSFTKQREDIYAFSIDDPLNIGRKDRTFNSISSSSWNDSSAQIRTTEKQLPVAKEKRRVRKHLFSDTDTDQVMTEVSWLRESSRRPKPKVTKYSRQAHVRPKAASPHDSYEDLYSPSQKPVKGNTKPTKRKPAMKEIVEQLKKVVKPAAAPSRPHAAVRRSRRAAAALTKTYREAESGDSQSESEEPPAPKPLQKSHGAEVMKKKTAAKDYTKSNMRLKSYHHVSLSESEQPHISKSNPAGQKSKGIPEIPEVKKRKENFSEKTGTSKGPESKKQSELRKLSGFKQQRPEMLPSETSKLNKKTVAPAEEQMSPLKDFMAASQTSFCPSPPFTETMRSAERSAPTLGLTCLPLLSPRGSPLPASPDPPCRDTPSSILLLPKPCSTVNSKGDLRALSFYSSEKRSCSSKTPSSHSVRSDLSLTHRGHTSAPVHTIGRRGNEISPMQQEPSPLLQTPLQPSAQPLLTSTLLEQDKPAMPSSPQSPYPEHTVSHSCHFSLSKVSSVSLSQSSTKSSKHSSRVKNSVTSAFTVSHKTEKTPSSERDIQSAQIHVSGPSRKRCISSSSNSEEDDEDKEPIKSKRREQHSPRMKPRKLFKSYTEISVESEVSQVMSPSHTMSSSHWEAETGDGDMELEDDVEAVNPSNLCQQLRTGLKKKFESRQKMVEVYNKQSLKTVQQHISSLNNQMTKHRTEKLEQVRAALLEEIHNLEQEETWLKSMERDLTIHWKKQITVFCSYHERDIRRNKTLQKALQSDTCPSLEYEEKIFTSEMCLIRKDMKSVQDRLLSQMQEGEVQSVKRGLHALFFP
ncbi:synaptonemal complex protein 2 [Halichoeres trimaculatus]|uniref:synaptonemal complex protein 2 n=1 Tax=Halichoeres trimaculatus TaxID=147232 RepID=UPI003D9F2F24